MILSFYDPVEYVASTLKSTNSVIMADIFRNYKKIFDRVAKNYKLNTYYIQGAPRPEELSYIIYNNPQYYWLILYANNVYDPFNSWIKPPSACYATADKKYENAETTVLYHIDVNGIKHYNLIQYEDQEGVWFDKGDLNRQYKQYEGALAPVTAYEHELLVNEEYRKIKIIPVGDLNSFMSDFIKELEKE